MPFLFTSALPLSPFGPAHEILVLYDFLGTVKVTPHECVIRTGKP